MSANVVTLEEIETHLACPERWEYEHNLSIPTPTSGRTYESRRQLFRTVIFDVLNAAAADEDKAVKTAKQGVERRWQDYTESSWYISGAQRQFDKEATKQALVTYLRDDGFEQLSNAVAWDTTYRNEYGDVPVELELDVVTKPDNGYEILRFLPNLNGVVFGSAQDDFADDHRTRERYQGRYVGSALRAHLSIVAGIREYAKDLSTSVRYTVTGLSSYVTTDDGPGADSGIRVEVESRDLTEWFNEHKRSNELLIEASAVAIQSGNTAIPDEFADDIRSTACPHCPFQRMCQTAFNWESEF